MLQQDFHRGNNPAYDKVAFVAEHYEELVFMYKDILEHLKQGGTGGGTGTGGDCTHISKQVESPYGFVQLDKESFKLIGYDLDNPDDIQFLLHNTSVNDSSKDIYTSSNGIEYHDTYDIDIGGVDTFLSRKKLDDFFDNPPVINSSSDIRITIRYGTDSTDYIDATMSAQYLNNKVGFLRALYIRILARLDPQSYFDKIQNNPITFTIAKAYTSDDPLYTEVSDSIENNPIYVGKSPKRIVTYNNVLLYPITEYGLYGHSSKLYIKYITPFQKYGYVTVAGTGDIVKYQPSYLSADLPKISGTHIDTHTFTLTIDPDIKDDY